MKTSILSLIAFVAAVILLTGTQGCYTQFSAAREEVAYEEQYSEREAPADTEDGDAEEGEYVEQEARPEADYGQDWSCQMRFGFDYYYPSTYWPSVGFTIAYNDPWYGWYDPWYSYGYPYYGYGYPYYGYGYPYYPYYDPWYGYPGYWYPTEVVPWQNREFGSTRGTGSTRGGTTRGSQGVNASNGSRQGITDPLEQRHMDLPTASGRTVTGGTAAGTRNPGASSATQSSRSKGSSRKDISRKVDKKLSPGQQGTRSARDNKRLYRDRGSVSGSSRNKSSDGTPSVQPQSPSSGGASSRGTSTRPSGTKAPSRSSGSTVRPAPAPAPSVAPAPSGRSGGSAPSGGGGARSGGGGGGGGRRR